MIFEGSFVRKHTFYVLLSAAATMPAPGGILYCSKMHDRFPVRIGVMLPLLSGKYRTNENIRRQGLKLMETEDR